MKLDINVPEAFKELYTPAPYKIYYGGRGGGKSVNVSEYLVVSALDMVGVYLCAREVQNSIEDSVHKQLRESIHKLGLKNYYHITDTHIKSKSGSEFMFKGLRRETADSLKSIPNIRKAWVEEGNTASKNSLQKLMYTLRSDDSEFLMTFNPEWEEDFAYTHFVTNAHLLPPGSIVRHVNYNDNPFFSDKQRADMEACRAVSEDEYRHVWLGYPRQIVDGAVYANELRNAEAEGRITYVPADKAHPVYTAWDLGSADFTAIWFFQIIAMEIRLIGYYENTGFLIDHYLEYLQKQGYLYDMNYMPHDADDENIRGKSIAVQARAKGFKVQVTPRPQRKVNGIEAVRQVFPRLVFDRESTRAGRVRLAAYRYEIQEDKGKRSLQPVHDDSSHAADALQTLALGLQAPKESANISRMMKPKPIIPSNSGGWMAC